MTPRVTATAAARSAAAALGARWGPLMFYQPAACCGQTAPMCYPAGPIDPDDDVLVLGEVDGCPVYVDRHWYRESGEPLLTLDVEPGCAEGFSLPPGPQSRFVLRSPGQ